jgi:ketosteroid isomerase-like protein
LETKDREEKAIELLRNAYAAFNRGDISAAVSQLDAQIEWTEPESFPGGGTYHGQARVSQYLTQSRANWAEGSSEPERFIVAGDRIVVFVCARIRPQGNSEWREVRLADVYTFRNGIPAAMRAFANRNEALEWAGVKEADR